MRSNYLRRLGNSDLLVSPVGLGCLQFSSGKGISGVMWPSLRKKDINDIVKASINGGINWFDTAELYGWGESERALSRSLNELNIPRNNIIIATYIFEENNFCITLFFIITSPYLIKSIFFVCS